MVNLFLNVIFTFKVSRGRSLTVKINDTRISKYTDVRVKLNSQ